MKRALLGAVAVLLAVLAGVAAGAALGDPGSDKDRIDARIGDLQDKLQHATEREQVLTSELSTLVGRVRAARSSVADAEGRLAGLESRLAVQRALLAELDERIRDQSERLSLLERELDESVARLERRVRELYMTDRPDALTVFVGADSFADVIDNLDMLRRIGQQDERIVHEVERARNAMREARAATQRTRGEARRVEGEIAEQTEAQRATASHLAAERDALLAAESDRRSALASIREDEATFVAEVDALEAQSAALAERIRAEQAAAERAREEAARRAAAAGRPAAPSPPTGSGLLGWPVNGPVTSAFGMRWGRMHEGIDIAVPTGVPVVAAASGTVIEAGWLGGYGLLVVIDHGGGLATAYAHNSSVAVSVGQPVAAGQVVAASGNTGNSSGPHVHFEVRVGGSAVDPLGYL